MASTTGDGRSAESRAGDAVQDAKEDLRERGEDLVSDARREAERFAEERKGSGAEFLRDLGNALKAAAKELDQRGYDKMGSYGRAASGGLDRAADNVDRKDVESLLRDVGRFAQREPGMFIAGSFVLGFAASRFLKSSEPEYGHNGGSRQPSGGIGRAAGSTGSGRAGTPAAAPGAAPMRSGTSTGAPAGTGTTPGASTGASSGGSAVEIGDRR